METEVFWKEEFGDDYHQRQKETEVGSVISNIFFFSKILSKTQGVKRIIELGAGTGQNLDAINKLGHDLALIGVEINEQAALEIPCGFVFRQSIFDFEPPNYEHADLAFTKGLLIHILPDDLPEAYGVLYRSSGRYVLICEYYNPTPVEVEYRGHSGKLWKRDFAGEMMEKYPDLQLVDYGFTYHKDQSPQDDLTWFLMEKRK